MKLYKVCFIVGFILLVGYTTFAVITERPAKPAQAQPQTTIWIRTPSGVEYTDSVDGQVRCYRYGFEPFQCMPLEKTP